MKKLYFPFFFVLLLNFCMLSAESSVEVRADAFIHSSHLFRKIYGDVGASYGIEASTSVYDCWEGWVNFDWFNKHGKSHVEKTGAGSDLDVCKGNSTRVDIANISFGVRYPFDLCSCFTPYVGIGPSFSWIGLKNKSFCSHDKESKWAFGGIAKFGVYYYFCDCMFLDVFVDYLYQPVHFHRNVDIGGFKTGAGIGFRF